MLALADMSHRSLKKTAILQLFDLRGDPFFLGGEIFRPLKVEILTFWGSPGLDRLVFLLSLPSMGCGGGTESSNSLGNGF